MLFRKTMAVALMVALVVLAIPAGMGAQSGGQILGTAKDEAKKPYEDYQVRARIVGEAVVATTTNLDQNAGFSLGALGPGRYIVELYNLRERKVVCTEGPFELSATTPMRPDVKIDCGRVPVAWLLLAAAGAAGITAGIVTRDTASGSQ